jgi:hypothetical protein
MDNIPLSERIVIKCMRSWKDSGFLSGSSIAKRLNCKPEEAEGALKQLAQANVVKDGVMLEKTRELGFEIKNEAVLEREKLLHKYKQRKEQLINQKNYNLKNLILAIGKYPEYANSRLKPGVWGYGLKVPTRLLYSFLFQYTVEEIEAAITGLEHEGLVSRTTPRVSSEEVGFEVLPRGDLHYKNNVKPYFKLGEKECILDEANRNHIELFYAWQSDYNPSRTKITDALEHIIELGNSKWSPIRPLKLVYATEPGSGAVRIDSQLIERIAVADIFLGDVTICVKLNNKGFPNPNVLVESGYALESKKPHQVFLLAHNREVAEIPGDESVAADFPFDITVVSRVHFSTPGELRSKLESEIWSSLNKQSLLLKEVSEVKVKIEDEV